MDKENKITADEGTILEVEKVKSVIEIKLTKEHFKKNYTLRAKIGIYIGVLIGLISIEFT